jgi:hypothetical protein
MISNAAQRMEKGIDGRFVVMEMASVNPAQQTVIPFKSN